MTRPLPLALLLFALAGLVLAGCSRLDLARVRQDVLAWLDAPQVGPFEFPGATWTDVVIADRDGTARVTIAGLALRLPSGLSAPVGDVTFDYRPGPDGFFALNLPTRVPLSTAVLAFGPGSRVEWRTENGVPTVGLITLRDARLGPPASGGLGIERVDFDWTADSGATATATGRLRVEGLSLNPPLPLRARLDRASVELEATEVPRIYLQGLGTLVPGGLSVTPPPDLPLPFARADLRASVEGGSLTAGLLTGRLRTANARLTGETDGAAGGGDATLTLEGADFAAELVPFAVTLGGIRGSGAVTGLGAAAPPAPAGLSAPSVLPFAGFTGEATLSNSVLSLDGNPAVLARLALRVAVAGLAADAGEAASAEGAVALEGFEPPPLFRDEVMVLFSHLPIAPELPSLLPRTAAVELRLSGLPAEVLRHQLATGRLPPEGQARAAGRMAAEVTRLDWQSEALTISGDGRFAAVAGPFGLEGRLAADLARRPGTLSRLWPALMELARPVGADRLSYSLEMSGDAPPLLNGQPMAAPAELVNPFQRGEWLAARTDAERTEAQAAAEARAAELAAAAAARAQAAEAAAAAAQRDAIALQSAVNLWRLSNPDVPPESVEALAAQGLIPGTLSGWSLTPSGPGTVFERTAPAELCPLLVRDAVLVRVVGISEAPRCPREGTITLRVQF